MLRAPGLEVPHVAVQPPSMKSGKGRVVFRPRLSVPFEFAGAAGIQAALLGDRRKSPPGARSSRRRSSTGWSATPASTWRRSRDRVLVARTRLVPNGVSRLLTDDEVPAFLDEAMELFRLVAVRRGWAPPPSS